MVGTDEFEDFRSTGDFAGDHNRPRGEVGAVFAKHRPIGKIDAGGQRFGQFDEERGRVVKGGAAGPGGVGGGLDFGVVVAEHQRTVATHQIDEGVAVHVAVTAAKALGGEIRHGTRHGGGGRGVPIDAAGDDGGGAAEKGVGLSEIQRELLTTDLLPTKHTKKHEKRRCAHGKYRAHGRKGVRTETSG